MNVKRPRRYESRLRADRALATRARVLEAAEKAFREHGYAGATIEGIATAAAVAVPTVYAAYGNKSRLLYAVLSRIGAEHGLQGTIREILGGDVPREQLRLVAALARELWAAGWDLIRIVEHGRGDPELDAWWLKVEEERHEGERALLERLSASGSLRSDLTIDEATDLLWALSGPSMYGLLVGVRKWSPEQYERWLGDSLIREFLRGSAHESGHVHSRS